MRLGLTRNCRGRDASGIPTRPWFEWWCVPGASEAATPHVNIVAPLPTDLVTAQAQVAFKQQHPGDVRSSNLYRRSHHCSDVSRALPFVVARYSLVKREAAKLGWPEDKEGSQLSGHKLSRILRSSYDEYTESRREGRIAKLCWEDPTLDAIYKAGDRKGGILRVLTELARRIDNNGVFVSEEARVMGQAYKAARAAGCAAGGNADYTAEERKQKGLKGEGSTRDLKAAAGKAGAKAKTSGGRPKIWVEKLVSCSENSLRAELIVIRGLQVGLLAAADHSNPS